MWTQSGSGPFRAGGDAPEGSERRAESGAQKVIKRGFDDENMKTREFKYHTRTRTRKDGIHVRNYCTSNRYTVHTVNS